MPRDNEFAGRVVAVTGGAGAGIGGATCRGFSELGASVAVLDEHGPRGERTATELRREFAIPVCAAAVDVADRAAVDAALETVREQLGFVDILINNAAINIQGSVFEYEPEDLERESAGDLTACL